MALKALILSASSPLQVTPRQLAHVAQSRHWLLLQLLLLLGNKHPGLLWWILAETPGQQQRGTEASLQCCQIPDKLRGILDHKTLVCFRQPSAGGYANVTSILCICPWRTGDTLGSQLKICTQ